MRTRSGKRAAIISESACRNVSRVKLDPRSGLLMFEIDPK